MDIFQAVKSARIQRAGLVQSAVCYLFSLCLVTLSNPLFLCVQGQYAYCHEVLADFINSYDNYANFKELV